MYAHGLGQGRDEMRARLREAGMGGGKVGLPVVDVYGQVYMHMCDACTASCRWSRS